MIRSILVPLDGSPSAEEALPLALAVARQAEAAVQLVHVHLLVSEMFAEARACMESTFDPRAQERAAAYLDDVVRRVEPAANVPVSPVLLEGSVPDALHEHVVASKADLVVMATHGRGPVSRFWLGSVADALVRRLPVPVLLVRPKGEGPDLSWQPALGRILVPLDGSRLAEQVLGPALDLGRALRAEFRLLQVIEPLQVMGEAVVLAGAGQYLDDALRQAESYLESVAEGLRAHGAGRVEVEAVIHPQPAAAILEEAEANHVGLIALATHGRRGLSRLLLGSIADKLVRAAPTPVLVYRPTRK
jgi:nucleotide-binding universal stress UspA family protein